MVIKMMHPWITGTSLADMDVTRSLPIPGHAKMVSMMIVPPSRCPNSSPIIVMTGINVFFNACLRITIL